jgi:hypothetical protein
MEEDRERCLAAGMMNTLVNLFIKLKLKIFSINGVKLKNLSSYRTFIEPTKIGNNALIAKN